MAECAVIAVLIDKEEQQIDMKHIEKLTGFSTSTVKRTLKALQEKHYIHIERIQGYASSYTITQDILPPKNRGTKQKALEAELKMLQKEAEVKKLKDQIQAEKDIEKYNCVINKF